jgi:hypothetical protein
VQGVRTSLTGRRISASENIRARSFALAEMVEIDRASVCVWDASSGTTQFLLEFPFFYNMKT